MEPITGLAARVLSIALVSDGCPSHWLTAIIDHARPDVLATINRLADSGMLRLHLLQDGTSVIRVHPHVTRLAPFPHQDLDRLILAWKLVRSGAPCTTIRAPIEAITRLKPHRQGHAIVPLWAWQKPWLAAWWNEFAETTTVSCPPPYADLPCLTAEMGHTHWVPFPTPLVISWPKTALYCPLGSQGFHVVRDQKRAKALEAYCVALHSHALSAATLIFLRVLRLLREGYTDGHAARHLGVSERHFRRYVAEVMSTLKATSRWQAAALTENGLWHGLRCLASSDP